MGAAPTPSTVVYPYSQLRYWGDTYGTSTQITTVAADKALPSVTIPTITNTINAAYLGIRIGRINNNGANTPVLDGDQYIQCDNSLAAGDINAIKLVDTLIFLKPNETITPAFEIVGSIDISSRAISGETLDIIWHNAKVTANDISYRDVQTFVILEVKS